eukprot:m.1569137 g.1569137  ORF g.1569137 m.1569137 type:complete len:795 (+) comp25298_c0_seq5:74-2458(+)
MQNLRSRSAGNIMNPSPKQHGTMIVILALFVPSSSAPAKSPGICRSFTENRVDCTAGNSKISEENCTARGCCYDGDATGTNTTCYYAAPGIPVTTIHVISSNHFDAGYADLTATVINNYFDNYFPRAASVGADLRKNCSQSLKWMTFSYLVSLYLDCPPGFGLHCPTEAALTTFKAAVAARDIVWPAFPTNAELAAADPSALRFGVRLSNDTADALGVKRPSVLSTRDVPGMPRSAIPTLVAAGVTGLSEGMNGRMVPVNVPPVFRWKDEASGSALTTLWHWHGYGQLGDPGNPIQVPGSSHAIAYNWRGDNAGPPMTYEETLTDFAKFEAYFPSEWNAKAVSSTLEEFIDALHADNAEALLPVVTQDLADTWVWGAASDAGKVMRMRALHRARTACEATHTPECSYSDPRYYNFSRLIQKNTEHTWGMSVFHYGIEANVHWDNSNFHKDLAGGQKNLAAFVQSWVEQRNYGVIYPIEALQKPWEKPAPPPHPLMAYIEQEFTAMQPQNQSDPTAAGFKKVSPGETCTDFGSFKAIQLDTTGALTLLTTSNGTELASTTNRLGSLLYQTLVLEDFQTWQAEYLIAGSGGTNEFGKPASFMEASPKPEHVDAHATVTQLWRKDNTILADVAFSTNLVQDYGAPATARINYTATGMDRVAVELTIFDKTATRLPEALYFQFNPVGSGEGAWAMDKLGAWVDPLDVADGASKGMHMITTGVQHTRPAATPVFFESPDAVLARWDKPLPFPTPIHRQPDLSLGVSYLLIDNIWNTNYPFWYPFVPEDKDTKFRFAIAA